VAFFPDGRVARRLPWAAPLSRKYARGEVSRDAFTGNPDARFIRDNTETVQIARLFFVVRLLLELNVNPSAPFLQERLHFLHFRSSGIGQWGSRSTGDKLVAIKLVFCPTVRERNPGVTTEGMAGSIFGGCKCCPLRGSYFLFVV